MINIIILIMLVNISLLIHKYAHYVMAKAYNLNIHKFKIGLGPECFKYKYRKTEYCLGIMPIGGYVSIDKNMERKLSLHKRCLIESSGMLLNLVIGMVALLVLNNLQINGIVGIAKNIFDNIVENNFVYIIKQEYGLVASTKSDIALSNNFNILEYIAIINFAIFLYNLIPIYIVDGGKVIVIITESFLTKVGINYNTANKIARLLLLVGFILLIVPITINQILHSTVDLNLYKLFTLIFTELSCTIGCIILISRNKFT